MDVESEDGADSGDEARARRRQEKLRAKQLAEAERLRKIEERRASLRQKEALLNTSDGDEDAEGESDNDFQAPLARLADLDTPAGR